MPNNRCTNCIAFNAECTHNNVRKRPGPYHIPFQSKDDKLANSPPAAIVLDPSSSLHPLVQTMISSPSSLDLDTQRAFASLSQHISKLEQEISGLKQVNETTPSSSRASSNSPSATVKVEEELPIITEGSLKPVDLSGQLKRLAISNSYERHFGSGSTMSLVGVALQVGKDKTKVLKAEDNLSFRRPQYWAIHPWEDIPEDDTVTYQFPNPDLLLELLSILYMHGTSQPEACWVMVGVGIRFAQDVGAHRKRFKDKLTVEEELWKRCFWLLVCIDALICAFCGRPRATVSSDFDLELPVECDDEFWETADPNLVFQQPPGKPSKIAAFISYIKLMEILEYAQRTLYAVNRKKCRGPAMLQSNEEIVSHLDSELNSWFETLPKHLKWISSSPGTIFYSQSAMLHACYYHVRILVHRPFIPLPNKPSSLPFPSLAICTNAARSCIRIMKTYAEQGEILPFPQVQFGTFTSAILLLVNYWTHLKSSSPTKDASNEDLKNVQDCISVLSKLESSDVARELTSYTEASISGQPNQCTNLDAPPDLASVFRYGYDPLSNAEKAMVHGLDPRSGTWDMNLSSAPPNWDLSTPINPSTSKTLSNNATEQWWSSTGMPPPDNVPFEFALDPTPYGGTIRTYQPDGEVNKHPTLMQL
ncbi:hypothetical protein H0H93_008416 [Arthromyces matolae]|nr:hypothetical protein H0H93_008416 [Arthromyces matolae]